ncbi:MAG TPA: tetratricopeptide repeat protein [Vicinamibacterales bacterium]|nr:tetratricopeptide repeat protein [Vicinamibacterales bacterium]
MKPLDDWPTVKRVLEGALAREGAERRAYVADACGADSVLRAQIEMLLASADRAETFLETPAVLLLDRESVADDVSGSVMGTYRLLSRLGAGGMGEVYLAHDDKLDRPVAIKFLSPAFAANRDRLRRFHQEARAVSSLNHPHILVVHDFGEMDGRPFMVTEFVEGETLRQRLRSGALPARDAVDIGAQIAGALAAAHARGLVHRDVKPENVMVRPDGYVKVLDFGLAKLLDSDVADGIDLEGRTLPGLVMGTPRYMSPEQTRGLDVDARTDLWSLGVVLYEMIAGRPPFEGATPADTIAAILGAEPMPLPSQAPYGAPLSAVIIRAIRKDRLLRYGDAEEMLADLRQLAPAVTSRQDTVSTVTDVDQDDEVMMSSAGERRRATVLVSIVSDYASLVERLATDQIDEVIGRVRAAAIDAMRRHGGVVNQSIGEEIVSLFGIPAANEDDDLRAVRAAFDLHARTREIGSAFAEPPGIVLRLQSGVHAGSVVAKRLREGPRRYAVTGQPMQTAARLAAAAEPDAILVSPDCHRRVAPFVRTEPRAPVAVRADAPPLTPHCVLGESGLDSRLDAVEPGALTPYSGRAAELMALQSRIDEAVRGEGRLVLVIGDAGSGKSRMLHELRTRLAASEFRILQGRCRSYGGMTSYLPFVEALHGALGIKEQDGDTLAESRLVARIRAIDASLEPLIPLYLHLLSMQSDRFPLPRYLRGEHFQAAMLDALTAFFTSYAHRVPSVLLFEDWHWADDASRQALRHLAEVIPAYPLLIVATTRPEAGRLTDAPHPAVRVSLGPLDPAASLAIMKAVLEADQVPQELAHRLHERSGGNPFFLEELCHALREAGLVTARGAEAVIRGSADALQLPDSVQAVIRSRLDRVPADGREVLRVASVIGREFARRILTDAMAITDLSSAIEPLKNAGLIQQIRVVPDPVYRFKHVLMQEVAYESLLEHQRKTLHQAVGRAIERSHPGSFEEPLELLAYHFGHAELWEDAIDYGVRAAERATELSQFTDALTLLERVHSALLRLPDEATRGARIADVLLRQERLCETLGLRGRQIELAAELIALLAPRGASVRLAEAYLRQGDVSTLLKRFDAADRALATSLRMSRECGDAALERSALRSIGLLRWHQGRPEDALAITEDALAIDRQRDDDLAVAGDLSNLGNILFSMGEHDRTLGILDEALAMPVVQSDPIKRSFILHIVANVHRALGDVPRALEYFQTADDSARAHMLPIQRSFHLTSIAHIRLQEGRLADSIRLYQEAVDLSRRARHAEGLAQSLRMLGEVLFGIGRNQEALPYLHEAAQLFEQMQDREAEAVMRHHAAVVLERGGHADAMAEWERVRALSQAAGDARAELDALEGIARATRASLPSSDAAIRSFEDALTLASRLGESRRVATLRNTLGVLHWEQGRYVEALAQYEAALALLRDLGDRVHEGLTLNSIGVTLSRLRRYEESRTALEDGLSVNRRSGERLLEAHSLAALGDVAETLGRLDAAVSYFEASLAMRREIKDRRGEGWMLHRLARTRALAGNAAGAETAAREAARIAAECDDAALRHACGATDDAVSGIAEPRAHVQES